MWQTIFQVFAVLAWLVSLLAVVRPLRLGRAAACAATLLLAAGFGKFAFFSLAGGNSFIPDLPQLVIWFCGWAYATAFFLTAFSVLACITCRALEWRGRHVSLRARRVCASALLAAAAAISAYGIWESIRIPSVRVVELAWSDLPAAFDGYRIVHISDLHCSTSARRERFERIAERVDGIGADLVAITGDFVDGAVRERAADLAPIAAIRARDGVVCCTGNHEAYWDWTGWSAKYREWKFTFPEGKGAMVVRRGADALAVGGLRDQMFDGKRDVPVQANTAFGGVPEGAFRILLSHRPSTEPIGSAEADVRLQLSGHTHGGAMPGLRQLVALMNDGHVRGIYEFAPGRFLHVSPGTGQWAGFPLRILTPAEITVIVLRRAKAAP